MHLLTSVIINSGFSFATELTRSAVVSASRLSMHVLSIVLFFVIPRADARVLHACNRFETTPNEYSFDCFTLPMFACNSEFGSSANNLGAGANDLFRFASQSLWRHSKADLRKSFASRTSRFYSSGGIRYNTCFVASKPASERNKHKMESQSLSTGSVGSGDCQTEFKRL